VDFRVNVGFRFNCLGIGSVDFRVDVGFRLNCLGIGSVDSRVNCLDIGSVDSRVNYSRLLRPRVGVPTLLLVNIGRVILGLELYLELPLLNLMPINVR
jgi:hypothetical protein